MYTKDKAFRITLRLNEDQFNFVKGEADVLGVSPSEFLRMVVNASLAVRKNAQFQVVVKEAEGRANDEANIDYIV